MTNTTKLQCRTWWVLLPLLLTWGCAAGSLPRVADGSVTTIDEDSGNGFVGSDVVIGGGDSTAGGSDTGTGSGGGNSTGDSSDSGAPPPPPCQPSCAGKPCGDGDGCGGTCSIGSGCTTSCGAWQAASPDDPWDDTDPNYDGERGCSGSLIKDFGRVGSEATCRAKCQGVTATCCFRDHRGDHKSCRAYQGKVIVVSSCTGCTAASCK